MSLTRRDFLLYSLGTGVALPLLVDQVWAQAPAKPTPLRTTVAVDSLDRTAAQTNVIVEFGMPLRPGALTNEDRIVVHDGATALKVQEDGRAADRDGAIRFVSVAVLLPSLPAGATKVLTVTAEPGKPAAGVDKSVAQLLALDPDAQCVVKVDNGKPHAGDFRTAASGATAWSKGKPHRRDAFFHDGALRKTFTCLMPMMAGTAPHSHVYVEFLATAFSADGFASDIAWRFDPVLLNGWADEPKPGDQMLDVDIATGAGKPVSRVAWTGRSPAVSIVVSAKERSVATSPPTPGTFNINDHGRVIQETSKGTRAVIIAVSADGAACTLRKGDGNNIAAATYAAGQWKIHGFNLPNMGCLWEKEVWHGRQARYQVRHERDHLFNSRMLLNYGLPSSYVDNELGSTGDGRGGGGISFLASQGNHPITTYDSQNHTYMGERFTQSNEPETTPLPTYQYISLRKLEGDKGPHIEASALTRVFRTADIWAMKETPGVFDDATGVLLNTGVNDRKSYLDNNFPKPINTHLVPPAGVHHEDNHWYIPYILTGRLFYFRAIHYQVMHFNISIFSFNDLGLTRPIWNTAQVRSKGWADRAIAEAAVVTPSGFNRVITGWSKADIMDWQESSWKQAYSLLINDGTGKTGWSSQTPPGPKYNGEDDPFYLPNKTPADITRPTYAIIHHWQYSYMALAGKHMTEIGSLTKAGVDLYKRMVGHIVNSLINEQINNPKAPSSMFGMGGEGYGVDLSEGKFLNWKELADFFIGTPGRKTPEYYRMYHYAALVAADEWGVYKPERTKKALQIATELMSKENKIPQEKDDSRSGKKEAPVGRGDIAPLYPSPKSSPGTKLWWIVKRVD